MDRIPVLFDTDIGSDIDDAAAPAYLLREPLERARLADALCRAAGKEDVPIYPGASRPLLVPNKQPAAKLLGPRAAGVTHWTQSDAGPHEIALEVEPELFCQRYFSVMREGANS